MIDINTGQNVAILADQEIARLIATGNTARDVVREKAMGKAIKLKTVNARLKTFEERLEVFEEVSR